MKHIGYCLEKIQIIVAGIPRELNSQAKKEQAEKILREIEKYRSILEKIIKNPKLKTAIKRLEGSGIQGIALQAHETEQLIGDLESVMNHLPLYIEELSGIIQDRPEKWTGRASQITQMIDEKFGGERGELRKEFQVALHTADELRELQIEEEHLAELLQ